MPEDCTGESNLQRVLDDLGVSRLNAHKFQTLQKLLEPMDVIKAPLAEVLLALCTQVRIEDSEYALHILNLIPNFIKKIKDGPPPLPDLVPSSLALLNTLKKNKQNTNLTEPASLQKSQYCFDIITSYPDETLIDLCDNYSCEIFEVIRIYCDKSIPAEIKIKPIKLVAKLLRILPPDKRAIFTKNGIDVWFSAVIPMVVDQAGNSDTIQHSLEALEILTDEIVQFDYEDNPNWQEVVKHIHAPSSYRAVIHRLLDEDSAYWHRLWIIFMKLLKTQLTKYAPNTTKKPINILLHSAEIAFRSNVPNRCRAFLCWNAIIDSFANEDHDLLLDKRLKLLMVPFKTNNARHEETALAKLDSWWHLITRFEADMENVFEIVVKPFLTFCFGTDAPKGTFEIPVHVSDKTKAQCVRAFINMIGHIQCEGCVPLPKLRVKLLNTKLLVKHRKEIIHSLGAAIRMCVELNGEFTERHIKCVWKSFIITIGELPENNLRRDIFNETLMLLEGFTQGCDDRLMSVIVNVLIPTLLDSNNKIRPLLNSKQDQQTSVYKIIGVLNKLPLNRLQDWKTALESIKLFTNWMVVSSASNNQMKWFVKTLLSDGILVWTALAESVEHDYCLHTASPQLLVQMLLWPFQFITTFVKREESTTAWLNLYKAVPRLQKKLINYDIVETLMIHADNQSSCLFVLSATIAVLEYKLKQKETGFNKEIGLMLQLTSTLNEEQIQIVLPSLAGVIFYTLISSIY